MVLSPEVEPITRCSRWLTLPPGFCFPFISVQEAAAQAQRPPAMLRGEPERTLRLLRARRRSCGFGNLILFFLPPAAFSSQLSLKSGQEMKGLRGQECLGSAKDEPAESAWWLRARAQKQIACKCLEGFLAWFCSQPSQNQTCSPSKRGMQLRAVGWSALCWGWSAADAGGSEMPGSRGAVWGSLL